MNTSPVLRIDNLQKKYKQVSAVKGVAFEVHPGEIVGLLGPNGAGKTTIINMVLGVLEPSGGSIEILEQNPHKNRAIMEKVNFTTVSVHVPGNLTVRQNLYVFGLLYGVPSLKEKIDALLKEFSLETFKDTKVGILSSGEQTRVALAKASINAPHLLLLDEPTASLDPSAAQFIRDTVKEFAKEDSAAILWTSHNMHEVEAVCDRVLFLSHGKVLLKGDPKELPKKYGKDNLEELFIAVAREPLTLEFD